MDIDFMVLRAAKIDIYCYYYYSFYLANIII